MTPSAHVDTFARDHLPPREAVAGLPVRPCRSSTIPSG